MSAGRVFSGVAAAAARRPLLTLAMMGALAACCALAALGLRPTAATDTLVSRSSSTYADTQRLYAHFGEEPVEVLVQGDLRKLVLSSDIDRLVGLEGCLSGNVPQSALVNEGGTSGPCGQLRRAAPVKVVFGPGTFLNEAALQVDEALASRSAQAEKQASLAQRTVYRSARARGLGVQQATTLGVQARKATMAGFAAEVSALAIRYGLSRPPTLDDHGFVSAVVFDSTKSSGTPKQRFAYLFPSRDAALVSVRLRAGLSEAQRTHTIALIRAAVAMPQWRLQNGERYLVTGEPVIVADITGSLAHSIELLLIAVIVVMAVVLSLIFKPTPRLLPLLIALLAAAFTFGALALSGASLTMASVAVLPVLVGLSVDYAIQFQSRVAEQRQAGTRDVRSAIATAAERGAPAIATAALASVGGLLVVLLSPVPMVRGFGILLVVGVLLAFLCALTAGSAAIALTATIGARRAGGAAGTARRLSGPSADDLRGTAQAGGKVAGVEGVGVEDVGVEGVGVEDVSVGGVGVAGVGGVGRVGAKVLGSPARAHARARARARAVAQSLIDSLASSLASAWQGAREILADNALTRFVSGVALGRAIQRPGRTLAIGLALAALGWIADTQIQVQTDIAKLAPQDLSSLKNLTALERATGIGGEIDLMVSSGSSGALTKPATIEWMSAYEGAILKRFGYTATGGCTKAELCPAFSLPDLFQAEASSSGKLSKRQVDGLLAAVPPYFSQGVITPDRRVATLTFGIRLMSLQRQQAVIEQMRSALHPPPGVSAHLAGLSVLAAQAGAQVASPARRALTLLIALAAVAAILLLAFRGDRRRALVPLLPIVFATGWSSLVLFVLRIPLNPMSVTLGALVIAISTEFSVLLSERHRQERAHGHSTAVALRRAYAHTGAALAASAVTAIAGFGVLALSNIAMLRDFGLVTLVDLSVSLLGVLIALPAAVVLAESDQSPTGAIVELRALFSIRSRRGDLAAP